MGPKGPDAVNSLARVPKGPDAGIKDARVFCNLPQSLTELNCCYNQLTSLDNLPQSLTILSCDRNELTSLNIANCDKLECLYCDNNNFPKEMVTILDDKDLTIQEKINKLIEGCLIPYDNSFILK